MSAAVTLLWAGTLGLWCAQNVYTYEFNFTKPDGSQIRNLSEYCKNSDCFVKCCPEKEIMLYKAYPEESEHPKNDEQMCIRSAALVKYKVKNPDNYSDIPLYNQDTRKLTGKTANDVKFIYDSNFIVENMSNAQYFSSEDISNIRAYFLENGGWSFKIPNYWYKFSTVVSRRFCVEHEVTLFNDDKLISTKPSVVVWVITDEETEERSNRRALSSAYAMLVSCFFLLLVLAVYAALPELRNLAGIMLMACTATYFAFFLIRIIHVFGNESQTLTDNGCVTLTIIFYYLMLATFCWMNVMSFDIWWKFRSIRKSCQIHRRGVMCKFLWYSAYAWGAPVLPTLFVVVVDRLDLRHWENFVTPHIFHGMCFFEGETHWLYVVLPIFLLICVNLIFFAMTSFNIWQVKRGVDRYNVKDSSNNQKDTYRFLVYLKLSLVMGVSWMLEVVGNLVDKNSRWWTISDLYNALIGVFIFLIFVCKRKTFLRLCERFSIDNRVVRYVREHADDSRAPDAPTKSNSQTTDISDVGPNCTPSYKDIKSKSDILRNSSLKSLAMHTPTV